MPAVERLTAALHARGVEAHVVGGAVRDRLLGRPARDIDVIVQGDATAICRALAEGLRAHPIVMDEERGYMRLVFPGDSATRWIDVNSSEGDLRSDLARRDFTINAMAVRLQAWGERAWEGAVEDPTGGRDDLRSRKLRQVSASALEQDPLRILRACRFAAQLSFSIESSTSQAMRRLASRITGVAPERTRDELFAALGGANAADAIRFMDTSGIMDRLLPEVAFGRGVEQPGQHHWDVLDHCIQTVAEAERILDPRVDSDEVMGLVPRIDGFEAFFVEEISDHQTRGSLLKIAALLHDVAKPQTKSVQPDGRTHFFGHSDQGAKVAVDVLARLRASRRTQAHVSLMIQEHLRPVQLSDGVRQPTSRALLRYFRDVAPVAVDTIYLAMADYLAARGPMLDLDDWRRHTGMLGDILRRGFEELRESKPSLLFDGSEIQRLFGLPPGPEIGRLLQTLREAEAAGKVQTHEEALDLLRVAVREGSGSRQE